MRHEIFFEDFWGKEIHVGDVFTQIKGCMLQTLWCFVGIEGAVVISGRAKDERQVGTATLLGYTLSLFLYVVIVLMSYGVLPREELAKVQDPALAFVVERVVGRVGAIIVNIGVLISVLGAWLSWTLLTAEIPYNVTTQDKLFPKFLADENKEGSATGALLINGLIKQIAFLLGIFTGNAWLAISNAATSMILVPYLFSCLYLVKVAKEDRDRSSFACGILGSIYGVWMLYAQGFTYLAQSGFIYAFGLIFLVQCSKENNTPVFVNKSEKIAAACVGLLGIWGAYTLISSIIS
jgi:arginine:ornithine antiporter/lysine permease